MQYATRRTKVLLKSPFESAINAQFLVGFIIKRDMQRLSNELPDLSPEQLEEVFDSLDQDKNGYLSPEEFVRGFGKPRFMEHAVSVKDTVRSCCRCISGPAISRRGRGQRRRSAILIRHRARTLLANYTFERFLTGRAGLLNDDDAEEERQFEHFVDSLGANVFTESVPFL